MINIIQDNFTLVLWWELITYTTINIENTNNVVTANGTKFFKNLNILNKVNIWIITRKLMIPVLPKSILKIPRLPFFKSKISLDLFMLIFFIFSLDNFIKHLFYFS